MSSERLGKPLVGGLQIFRVNARFARHRHEIRIANPARQHMQVQVPGDSCARRAAKIHAQVHAVRLVLFAVNGFETLRERSEEHTSELQSQSNLVCRLLLEKKKKTTIHI